MPVGRAAEHETRRTGSLLAIFSCVSGLLLGSPVVMVLGPLVAWFVPMIVRRHRTRVVRDRSERLVIDVCEGIAQQLRAGNSLAASVTAAIESAPVPLDQRFEPVRRAMQAGAPPARALGRADTERLESLGLLATALAVLLDNGGPVVVAIDRIGETVRSGVEARAEAQAQTGQATASALLLAALPLPFAVVVGLIEPAAASLYLTSWTGALCLGFAAALSAAGWLWIDQAVHR